MHDFIWFCLKCGALSIIRKHQNIEDLLNKRTWIYKKMYTPGHITTNIVFIDIDIFRLP
jgi:hypothetical protein